MAGGSPVAPLRPKHSDTCPSRLLGLARGWRGSTPLSPHPEEHVSAKLAVPLGAAPDHRACRPGGTLQIAHRVEPVPGLDRLFCRCGVDGSRSPPGADGGSSIIR